MQAQPHNCTILFSTIFSIGRDLSMQQKMENIYKYVQQTLVTLLDKTTLF